MKPKTIILIKTCALILSAIVTVVTMWHASGQTMDIGVLGFMLWGISPYICFSIVTYLLERFTATPHIRMIGCFISFLMLGFTLLGYKSMFGNRSGSSTDALVFVFVPLWLFIGSFLLLGLGSLISWLSARRP